jgi:uncharacterized protein YueI
MNNDNVNDRLEQSSMGGTPKINPDEQRRYLGTFRERVSLAIKIADLSNTNTITALKDEFKNHDNYQLIINGNIEHNLIAPFIQLASQNNIKFVIKTDSFYKTGNDNYGVVYANKASINVNPIDFIDKYPQYAKQSNETKAETSVKSKTSLLSHLKNMFK